MWWYALTRGMVVLVARVKFEGSGPLVFTTLLTHISLPTGKGP